MVAAPLIVTLPVASAVTVTLPVPVIWCELLTAPFSIKFKNVVALVVAALAVAVAEAPTTFLACQLVNEGAAGIVIVVVPLAVTCPCAS